VRAGIHPADIFFDEFGFIAGRFDAHGRGNQFGHLFFYPPEGAILADRKIGLAGKVRPSVYWLFR
jgi:hypothetical protein